MKYIKLFEQFLMLNEAINFKLNDNLDDIINSIPNKKKAKVIETLLVKSILTEFYNFIKDETDREIDVDYQSWNTQKKLDYFLNNTDSFLKNSFDVYINRRYNNKLTSIIDYIHTNSINSYDFEELYQKSVQWHRDIAKGSQQDRDDSKKVIRTDETDNTDKFISYPNGFYWINLNTSFSEDEKKNMGHCGQDIGKILFSLRDNNSNSHITVSYNIEEKAMYQCKGRGNSKPLDKFHPYIIDLFYNEKYPINNIFTGSWKPHLDFNLTDLTEVELSSILSKKPQLEYTNDMFEIYLTNKDYSKILAMIENGFYYGGKKVYGDLDLLKFVINQKADKDNIINTDWYKPTLDLNTTKEGIQFYVENFNSGIIESNLSNIVYVLWKNEFITSVDAESKISDLKIVDGKWYIKHKNESWSDYSFMYSDDDITRDSSYSYKEYVEKNINDYERDYLDLNFDGLDFDDLTTDTKKAILDKIEEDGLVLDGDDIEELINSDEDFGFETIADYSFEKIKVDIINDEKYGGDKLKVLLGCETLSDIKNNVKGGFENAQELANESEMFNIVMRPFKEFFNIDEFKSEGEYLLLEFDPKLAILLDRASDNGYYLQSLFRVVEYIFDSGLREDAYNEFGIEEDEFPDFLEFKFPYYGFNGTVDKYVLHEEIINRLY